MEIHEMRELGDADEVVVTGADLKRLHYYSTMLRSGLSPKGEMCFIWGDNLSQIVRKAVPLT